MQHNKIANLRLISQRIVHTKFKSVKDIVAWMGAVQAQDLRMAKWAIRLGLKKATEVTVNEAINSGQILRTHILRPMWHFVSADDIYWMLQLTAPKIRTAMKGRNKELELDDAIFKKSNSVLERSLRNNNHLTRKIKKTKTIITVDFFNFMKKENYFLLQHQSEKLGYFLNSKTELIISERNKD